MAATVTEMMADIVTPPPEKALTELLEAIRVIALSEPGRWHLTRGGRFKKLCGLRSRCQRVPGLLLGRAEGRSSSAQVAALHRQLDRCRHCAKLAGRFESAEWRFRQTLAWPALASAVGEPAQLTQDAREASSIRGRRRSGVTARATDRALTPRGARLVRSATSKSSSNPHRPAPADALMHRPAPEVVSAVAHRWSRRKGWSVATGLLALYALIVALDILTIPFATHTSAARSTLGVSVDRRARSPAPAPRTPARLHGTYFRPAAGWMVGEPQPQLAGGSLGSRAPNLAELRQISILSGGKGAGR